MQIRQPVLPAEAVRTSLLPALKILCSEAMHVSGLFLHSQPPMCSCESFHVAYLDKRPLILSYAQACPLRWLFEFLAHVVVG